MNPALITGEIISSNLISERLEFQKKREKIEQKKIFSGDIG